MVSQKKEEKIKKADATQEAQVNDIVDDILDEEMQNIDLNDEGPEYSADGFTMTQEKYETVLNQNSNLEAQILRLQADFDNFRKRTKQEKNSYKGYVVADLAEAVLPAIDNFNHAIRAMEKDEACATHLTGIAMISKQLKDAFAGFGLEEIQVIGADFDPNIHQAIAFEEVEDDEQDNKIIAQFQAGYKVGDKLIRPSMVKVGKKS